MPGNSMDLELHEVHRSDSPDFFDADGFLRPSRLVQRTWSITPPLGESTERTRDKTTAKPRHLGQRIRDRLSKIRREAEEARDPRDEPDKVRKLRKLPRIPGAAKPRESGDPSAPSQGASDVYNVAYRPPLELGSSLGALSSGDVEVVNDGYTWPASASATVEQYIYTRPDAVPGVHTTSTPDKFGADSIPKHGGPSEDKIATSQGQLVNDDKYPTFGSHTISRFDDSGEEFLPKHRDPAGDNKVTEQGQLLGGRRYRCRAFPLHSDNPKLFMKAVDCAQELGYSNIDSLFEENKETLVRMVNTYNEVVVSALSVFRQFGSRIIQHGRVVHDDYFEHEAKRQGFTDDTIWRAACSGDEKKVLAFLDANLSDGKLVDSSGRNTLSYAAEFGREAVVKTLLKLASRPLGYTLFIKDHFGLTPISYAADGGHDNILKLLLHGRVDGACDMDLADLIQDNWHEMDPLVERSRLLDRLCVTSTKSMIAVAGFPKLTGHSVLQFQWEIPNFVKQLIGNEADRMRDQDISNALASFVTLTGNEDKFECSTCLEFLRSAWGGKGVSVLEAIAPVVGDILRGPKGAYSRSSLRDTNVTITCATSTGIILDVLDVDLDLDFLNSLKWMCSAIRHDTNNLDGDDSRKQSIRISKAYQSFFPPRSQDSHNLLVHPLEKLENFPDASLSSNFMCWTKLFRSAIIAWQPVERNWGLGLKISFGLMAHLADVGSYYHIFEGTILLGLFTALIPTSCHAEGHGIQYHLEYLDPSGGEYIRPRSLKTLLQYDWFKTKDQLALRYAECYVGWFEEANILLGTSELLHGPNRMGPSRGLKERIQTAHRSGYELGGQIGFTTGMISGIGTSNQVWSYRSNVQRFNPTDHYIQSLFLNRLRTALVIDSESKQAWLVPKLSLILHLCHRYFEETKSRGMSNPIPYAKPSHDGAQAVIDAVQDQADLRVFGSSVDSGNVETFRHLFIRILHNLDGADLVREIPSRKLIFASELMHHVMHLRSSPLKEIPIHKEKSPWPDLTPFAEKADVIGVCSGIGQVIQPVPPPNTTPWENCLYILPQDRFYLATHMMCLSSIFDSMDNFQSDECLIGKDTYWEVQRPPWLIHQRLWEQPELTQRILQRIRTEGTVRKMFGAHERRGKMVGRIKSSVPREGVVVFGRVR